MSSPRVRRLQSDHDRIMRRFAQWPLIEIELAQGVPPDMYRIWYNINGIYTTPDGRILERNQHVLEIKLGLEYPRRAPQLRLLTPIFHPNFNETEVCAQDLYAASEGLDDLIVRIGRMIAFQEYNTKSPLNGIAARWAAENSTRLPVDAREIGPPEPKSSASAKEAPDQSGPPAAQERPQASGVVITARDVSAAGRQEAAVRQSTPLQAASTREPADGLNRQSAETAYKYASQFHADGNFDKAQPLLERLLAAFPNNTRVMYASAVNLAALGRKQEAVALAEALVNTHGYTKASELLEQLKRP